MDATILIEWRFSPAEMSPTSLCLFGTFPYKYAQRLVHFATRALQPADCLFLGINRWVVNQFYLFFPFKFVFCRGNSQYAKHEYKVDWAMQRSKHGSELSKLFTRIHMIMCDLAGGYCVLKTNGPWSWTNQSRIVLSRRQEIFEIRLYVIYGS